MPFFRRSSSRVTSIKMFAGACPAIPAISSTMLKAWFTLLRKAGDPGSSSSDIPTSDIRSLFRVSMSFSNPKLSSRRISMSTIARDGLSLLGFPSRSTSIIERGPQSVSAFISHSNFFESFPHPAKRLRTIFLICSSVRRSP